EGRLRNDHAGQLLRARESIRDLPLDEVGLGEELGKVAEARDDGGGAEVGLLVGDEFDLERVTGLGALDVQRALERMAESEVQATRVGVGALPRELAGEP